MIDHDLMPSNKIFVTIDASDYRSGAVLSFGTTWETAQPVAYDSMTFKGAELNYPVHEKETSSLQDTPLLAVAPLTSPSSSNIPTIKLPARYTHTHITADKSLLTLLEKGYENDPWTKQLTAAAPGMPNIQQHGKLWFIGDRLVVPNDAHLHETIFRLAHDVLGHFGPDKSYEALHGSFYWPNMCRDLETSYVPGCTDCQRNKSSTRHPFEPLHPLPVPDNRGDSMAMDFVGPLPTDEGYSCILTMTDHLGADVQIVPTSINLTAEKLAEVFFDRWYCENGLPSEIISDCDKIFMSKFWKALHKLTGVKIKASTAYHPQTDGSSEHTNKTVIQVLRYHVEQNQWGWVRALP